MCPFAVATDGGRCLIMSTVRLGHVEKWTFLISRRRAFQTGLDSVEWYHYSGYVLVLDARALSAADRGWLSGWHGFLSRLTCHITDMFV